MSVDLLTLQLCRLSHRWVQLILPVRIIDTVGTEDPEALRNQRSTPYGCGDRGHDLDVSLVADLLLLRMEESHPWKDHRPGAAGRWAAGDPRTRSRCVPGMTRESGAAGGTYPTRPTCRMLNCGPW